MRLGAALRRLVRGLLKAGRAGPRPSAAAVSPLPGVEGPGREGGRPVRLRKLLQAGGAVRPRTREVARLTERVKGR